MSVYQLQTIIPILGNYKIRTLKLNARGWEPRIKKQNMAEALYWFSAPEVNILVLPYAFDDNYIYDLLS